MSALYASIKGAAKTQATRRGHKTIQSHTRGWDVGVEVIGTHAEAGDHFEIYATCGSRGPQLKKLVGFIGMKDGELKFVKAHGTGI